MFLASYLTARGVSIEIDGNVDVNYPSAQYEISVPFHIIENSNKWQIQVQFKNYKEFCWFDGGNVSSFLVFPKTNNNMLYQAKVLNGNYPYNSDPTVQFIWLAFNSSQYLSSNTNTMPALWQMGSLDPVREAIDIKTLVLMNSSIKLPLSMDFFMDTSHLSSITNMHYLSKTVSTLELEKNQSGYKQFDGYLLGSYAATSSTNCGGRSAPLDFTFTAFGLTKDKDEHSIRQVFHGVVNAIKISDDMPIMPELQYPIYVDDGRFFDAQTKIDSISYVVTNQNWPAIDDEQLQKQFNEKKKQQAAVINLPNLSEAKIRLITNNINWIYNNQFSSSCVFEMDQEGKLKQIQPPQIKKK